MLVTPAAGRPPAVPPGPPPGPPAGRAAALAPGDAEARAALEAARLTLTRMAEELGIPRATLEAYRLGTRRAPAAARARLAAFLAGRADVLRDLAAALAAADAPGGGAGGGAGGAAPPRELPNG